MESILEKPELIDFLVKLIPEAHQDFESLPAEVSDCAIAHKLAEVTTLLLDQNRFRAVKHCLLAADELLLHGSEAIKTFINSVYIHRLTVLIDRADNRAEMLEYLLPHQLRIEYLRQLNTCLP
ncbi:DUF7674 family protein [Larkinella terrae]|uniref:DUF7674 domain-containing protein n=1 Tax=Larkinella terrae TaxID=2025311 RepID=A0A7K0EMZ1_9BACT|nr:hypothetical protein [Larkinella terrae]MRS63165.1 hypothetical protein [Larkinella terrae]